MGCVVGSSLQFIDIWKCAMAGMDNPHGSPRALVRRMRETLTMSLKQHFWLITLDIEVNDSRVPVYR